ncbi:hypothetical protein HRG_014918 [Hirsutella rhossiliensis]
MGRPREILLYLWNFRYLPLKYRWPLIKFRRRLLPTKTGLGLRHSFRYAHSFKQPPHLNPFLFVARLLWPFPSWYFKSTLPPPPRDIMAAPDDISCQVRDLMALRSLPLWRARDTPQRAFYRLYEALCAADGHMITYETEYFWHRSSPRWATSNIPDPECEDREQYAVMASLAEALVNSFNWRLELGLRRNDELFTNRYIDPLPMVPETYPSWTANVLPLEEQLLIHPDEHAYFDSPFHRRNVYMATGHFYTV